MYVYIILYIYIYIHIHVYHAHIESNLPIYPKNLFNLAVLPDHATRSKEHRDPRLWPRDLRPAPRPWYAVDGDAAVWALGPRGFDLFYLGDWVYGVSGFTWLHKVLTKIDSEIRMVESFYYRKIFMVRQRRC